MDKNSSFCNIVAKKAHIVYLYTIMSINNKPAPDAIVLYANYAVFSPGKTITHSGKVQSRMLLWCKNGKGIITVNGETFPFSAGRFLFIPWNHMIYYKADEKDPFLLAGIHIVPELKKRGNIHYKIFHGEINDLKEYKKRKNTGIPDFSSVFSGNLFMSHTLEILAEYIIAWFQKEPREEFIARNLAHLLIYELMKAKENQSAFSDKKPQELQKLLLYMEKNIEKKLQISDLSRLLNSSRSTIFRLFKKHLNCTPVNWILKRKVHRAEELLCKTNLRIGEIGTKISIDDPYYFSKVFKKFTGVTAREFRNGHSLVKNTMNVPLSS
ncbi:MAG: hypothetical protein A2017_16860 [Lentisphaerae bacterium GWF2_44_16]|nr:MAG: hypothetical protein A2017_16860 [Lentisphaerae bacterium GWF2_44_16]